MKANCYLSVACVLFLGILILTGSSVMAIEKAKYEVIESDGDFELRQYGKQIVAETILRGRI